MMRLFYVRKPMFGIEPGRVERFAVHKTGAYLAEGFIEPYDEKKHGDKPGAPPFEEKKRREREAAREKAAPARQDAAARR